MNGLDPLFAPASVAVLGASAKPGKLGTAMTHVLRTFPGPVLKVNAEMIADAQQAAKASVGEFKEKVVAYLKAHPDAAAQLQRIGQQGQTQGK